MVTISIQVNTNRPSVDPSSDEIAFGAGTFSWQDPVHSWKAGPGEVISEEYFFLFIYDLVPLDNNKAWDHIILFL